MNVGKALKEIRKSLNYTQKQMVAGTSITVSHYSKIENDNERMQVYDLFEILNARRIDIRCFKEIYDSNNKENNVLFWEEELTKAFYSSDINRAKNAQRHINDFNEASELKVRAKLVVAVLEDNLLKQRKELNKVISSFFINNDNWTKNQDILKIIGNSMRVFKFETLKMLMNQLLKKYQNLYDYSLEIQKRIGSIYLNYLHILYDEKQKELSYVYLQELDKLPDIPELAVWKLMKEYYYALLKNNVDESKEILKIIIRIAPKIGKSLPII